MAIERFLRKHGWKKEPQKATEIEWQEGDFNQFLLTVAAARRRDIYQYPKPIFNPLETKEIADANQKYNQLTETEKERLNRLQNRRRHTEYDYIKYRTTWRPSIKDTLPSMSAAPRQIIIPASWENDLFELSDETAADNTSRYGVIAATIADQDTDLLTLTQWKGYRNQVGPNIEDVYRQTEVFNIYTIIGELVTNVASWPEFTFDDIARFLSESAPPVSMLVSGDQISLALRTKETAQFNIDELQDFIKAAHRKAGYTPSIHPATWYGTNHGEYFHQVRPVMIRNPLFDYRRWNIDTARKMKYAYYVGTPEKVTRLA